MKMKWKRIKALGQEFSVVDIIEDKEVKTLRNKLETNIIKETRKKEM